MHSKQVLTKLKLYIQYMPTDSKEGVTERQAFALKDDVLKIDNQRRRRLSINDCRAVTRN